jgi:hypothetical protein
MRNWFEDSYQNRVIIGIIILSGILIRATT